MIDFTHWRIANRADRIPITRMAAWSTDLPARPVAVVLSAQPFTKESILLAAPVGASYDGSASASRRSAASTHVAHIRVRSRLWPNRQNYKSDRRGKVRRSGSRAWSQQDSTAGSRYRAQWPISQTQPQTDG